MLSVCSGCCHYVASLSMLRFPISFNIYSDSFSIHFPFGMTDGLTSAFETYCWPELRPLFCPSNRNDTAAATTSSSKFHTSLACAQFATKFVTTYIILRIVVRSFRIIIILCTLNSFLPHGTFAYHTHVSYALSPAHGTLNSFLPPGAFCVPYARTVRHSLLS